MRKIAITLIIILALATAAMGMDNTGTAYVVRVHGEVDLVMARHVERAIALAEAEGARAIIIDIDTPGGLVSAALDISKAIMRATVPTVAVVTGQAWSAGALIALSARNLYMLPGTAIGAAEPIPTTEKIVSAWRSALESAAESTGRDALLAAAMVDRDIEVPGVVERGKLLSLSSQRAVELNMADAVVSDIKAALELANMGQVMQSLVEESSTERIARFLTTPGVSVILLTLGLAGIIIEITTVGFGVPGVLGILSLSLYFGGSIISGQATGLVLLLFFVGLGLLVLEAFLPGFGIAGITGILVIITSIVIAAGDVLAGLQTVALSFIASLLLIYLAWRLMARRQFLDKVSLKARSTSEEGYVATPKDTTLLGAEGTAITTLRPAGIAQIAGRQVSVITEGRFVPAGTAVLVARIEGQRVVVEPKKQTEGK